MAVTFITDLLMTTALYVVKWWFEMYDIDYNNYNNMVVEDYDGDGDEEDDDDERWLRQ